MSKQKFQNKTLYTKRCVDNILAVYDQATEEDKFDWYFDARQFARTLAAIYFVDYYKVCGIIAAISPQTNWKLNKKLAEEFINTGKAKHTGMFLSKAEDILNGSGSPEDICDVLNGNKITSFFLNIAFPNDIQTVTIDRHAQDIALGGELDNNKRSMTLNQYNFFSNCYRIAAGMRSLPPYMMQSVTWVKWRKL